MRNKNCQAGFSSKLVPLKSGSKFHYLGEPALIPTYIYWQLTAALAKTATFMLLPLI